MYNSCRFRGCLANIYNYALLGRVSNLVSWYQSCVWYWTLEFSLIPETLTIKYFHHLYSLITWLITFLFVSKIHFYTLLWFNRLLCWMKNYVYLLSYILNKLSPPGDSLLKNVTRGGKPFLYRYLVILLERKIWEIGMVVPHVWTILAQ